MSFFDKLKGGMGIDASTEEKEKPSSIKAAEDKEKKKPSSVPASAKATADKKVAEDKVKERTKKPKVEKPAAPEGGEPRPEKSGREPEPEPEPEPKEPIVPPKERPQSEGQLAIDIYETNGDLVIQSTIAGIRAEDLDISIENDLVTIRGSRQNPIEVDGKKYFYQECYWGAFSRQVILPEEVDGSRAEAKMKDGVLTLKIPKIGRKKKRKVAVEQEE